MEGGSIFLVEPISGIERQQLDFRSFGQVCGFVNDQPAGLHSSFNVIAITVAAPRNKRACAPRR